MTAASAGSARAILDTIGDTPLVRLAVTLEKEGLGSELFVKLEFFNPTASLKDRIYKEMIRGAVERGDLKPGMEILEASTGNAGIACAFVGSLFGYRVTVVMPEGMSDERKQTIRAFGGDLILTPGAESDVDLSLQKVEELRAKHPGRYWFPDQFSNPDNPTAHYRTTGPEIWSQSGGRVDGFIASQGTGGTLNGVGRYLRERNPTAKLYAVEPSEAPVLAHGKWGTHKIEGIGDGFVPKNLDLSLLNGVVTVSSEEALDMTRRLVREEGIFGGISSGSNVAGAVKLLKRHPEIRRLVTMVNDSGGRYLSTELFGVGKVRAVPRADRELDAYSREQLRVYRAGLEIIS